MSPTTTMKILLVGATGFAILTGIAWIYNRGANDALVTIERKNHAAGTRSDEARGRYDRCIDDGELFDFGTRRCIGPAQDRRQ